MFDNQMHKRAEKLAAISITHSQWQLLSRIAQGRCGLHKLSTDPNQDLAPNSHVILSGTMLAIFAGDLFVLIASSALSRQSTRQLYGERTDGTNSCSQVCAVLRSVAHVGRCGPSKHLCRCRRDGDFPRTSNPRDSWLPAQL